VYAHLPVHRHRQTQTKCESDRQLSTENVSSLATIRNFAKKICIFLWQMNVKIYFANVLITWPVRTRVSIISFLKNGIKVSSNQTVAVKCKTRDPLTGVPRSRDLTIAPSNCCTLHDIIILLWLNIIYHYTWTRDHCPNWGLRRF